jgi:hypothetical protein
VTRLTKMSALAEAAVAVTATAIPIPHAHAAPTRYEAETGTCDGTVTANHRRHSGTGFCDSDGAVGAASPLSFTAAQAGTAAVGTRVRDRARLSNLGEGVRDGRALVICHDLAMSALQHFRVTRPGLV